MATLIVTSGDAAYTFTNLSEIYVAYLRIYLCIIYMFIKDQVSL